MRTNITTATTFWFTYYIILCVGTAIPPAAEIICQILLEMGRPCSIPPESTPTTTVESFDPTNCSINQVGCARASISASPTCNTAHDCTGYCEETLGFTEKLGSTCLSNIDPSTGIVAQKLCSCYNGTAIVDIVTKAAVAIGETACWVWTSGIALTEAGLTAIGTIPVPPAQAAKWAGKVLKVGNHLLADGQKLGKCDNSFCPGHRFTMIDPEKLSEELGALNMC